MSSIRYNKSKTYLLPLLSELLELDLRFFHCIDNTYIFDDKDQYKNCIFILHDFSFKNPEFTQYEHRLTSSQYFVDLIDIDTKVLYIFRFPEEYMIEYNHFINGKYSLFGEDAKNLILSFFTEVYQNNINAVSFLVKVKQILFKDDKLKKKIESDLNVVLDEDAELNDPIEPKQETYPLSLITDKQMKK